MKSKLDKEEQQVCPECKSSNIVLDESSGEMVCAHCGLVVTDTLVSKEPEWRAFNHREREAKSRVGMPLSLSIHDKGLSTTIGKVSKDANGRSLPTNKRYEMLRLKKWHIRSTYQDSSHRNLSHAMTELSRLCDKMHLPKPVKEKAASIYRKALDDELVRGRSINAISAASLYAACRTTKTPRTLIELSKHSTIDKKDLARCYRLLIKELELQMPIPRAKYRVPKIAAKINLGEKTQQKAVNILREAEEKKITAGKDPMGLAAAALYIACVITDDKRTQKTIANAAGVTEVTIRNRYKGLTKELGLTLK